MKQKIIGYHLDKECFWVARLVCGHFQHVRHQPPWINRPWTQTENGRRSMLGTALGCKKCDRNEPRDWPVE
ncbi:DUF3565 domain-containing protein [Motiliproteus sp. MSK22-1]|uniref:DUF3565 domain-containing protein n=1 Tax=Motiliproteus sp. MSK22-1 TaxID=1897630 RepID=UPI0009761D5D|nr:DUF3565 domain-containing protein [Motiliproteus sp. MSK22-1]